MRTSNCLAAALALGLAACDQSETPPAEPIRPVKSMSVQVRSVNDSYALTGVVRAEEEITLAFRLDGKLIERNTDVGKTVHANDVLARLDPQLQLNQARAAEADLSSAQAMLTTADRNEKNGKDNYNKGLLSRPQYDQLVQQLQSARAQVDAAQARLSSAREQVNYTELYSDVNGLVIAKGAEPGEVVRAGQPILRIARDGRKVAVFDVPSRFMYLQDASKDIPIDVRLADNPNIHITGFIREIGVQADPVSRAVPVKVGLPNAPDEMVLGGTVTGTLTVVSPGLIEIPSAALTDLQGDPAVWVINPSTTHVSPRQVRVSRYNPGSVVISGGLQNGERIVTAGVQFLRPGQQVKLLDSSQ